MTTKKKDQEIEVAESEQLTFIGATVVTGGPSPRRGDAESIALAMAPDVLHRRAYYNVAGVLRDREVVAFSGITTSLGLASIYLMADDGKGRLAPVDSFPGFIGTLTWVDRFSATVEEAAQRLGLKLERYTDRIAAPKKGGSK